MMNGLLCGCLTLAVLSAGACSSDDSTADPDAGGSGGSAGTPVDASRDVGARAGSGGSAGAGTGGTAGARVDAGPDARPTTDGGSTVVDAAADAEAGPLVCLTAQYTNTTAFGAIFDSWQVATGGGATDPRLVPMPGVGADGGFEGTVVELDTMDGNPTPGSAKLTIPFTEPNQTLTFSKNFAPGVNMQGTTVTAQIKLDLGLISGPTDVGEAFLVVKATGSYVYAPSTAITLDPTAGWRTLTLNVDAPSPDVVPGYTPCDIREIDIVIRTGGTGTYRTAVVHIDTIAVTVRNGDGGTAPDASADAAETGTNAPEASIEAAADAGSDASNAADARSDAADARSDAAD
jgi:hypothetical protein